MYILKSFVSISLTIMLSSSLITDTLYGFQNVLAQTANNSNVNNTSITTKKSFLRYSNMTLGLNIFYPAYWQQSEGNNTVSFTSPLKTVGVRFAIIPSANMSLDEFTTKRILALRENLVNFNINRTRSEEFLSNPAQMIMFSFGNSPQSKILQAWTIKDNKVYIATYFADAVLFDTFLPIALKIINSVRINIPVVPEFGTGVTMVFALSSAGILIICRRYRRFGFASKQ